MVWNPNKWKAVFLATSKTAIPQNSKPHFVFPAQPLQKYPTPGVFLPDFEIWLGSKARAVLPFTLIVINVLLNVRKSKLRSKKYLNLCSQKPENLSSCKKFIFPLMLKKSIKIKKKLLGILQSNFSSICSNAEKTIPLTLDNSDFCMLFFKHKYTENQRVIQIFKRLFYWFSTDYNTF